MVTQTTEGHALQGKAYAIDPNSNNALTYSNNDLKDVRELLDAEYGGGGIHIIFMPTIEKRLQRDFAPSDVIEDMSTKFGIPPFFFDSMGWNANGFSGVSESQVDENGRTIHTYNTHSRYLTKRVIERKVAATTTTTATTTTEQDPNSAQEETAAEKEAREKEESNKTEAAKWAVADPQLLSQEPGVTRNRGPSEPPPRGMQQPGTQQPQSDSQAVGIPESILYNYDWDYMGFCSVWKATRPSGPHDPNTPTQEQQESFTNILLCFDLSLELKEKLMAAVATARQSLLAQLKDPFCLLNLANEVVLEHFYKTLWSFQKPVRSVEKARLKGWEVDPQGKTSKDQRDKQVKALVKRYADMHELNRHVHHVAEVLQVASRTLDSIITTHKALDSTRAATSVSQRLQFQALFIGNLKCRADAFTDRMKNETRFISNRVAIEENDVSKGILDQTRNDGKILSDTVSVLTLLFLPGTFVSGFFGMNFFTIDGHWTYAAQLWYFFVITGPITLAGLLLFLFELNVVGWVKDTVTEPMKELPKRLKKKWKERARSAAQPQLRRQNSPVSSSSRNRTVSRKDEDSPSPV